MGEYRNDGTLKGPGFLGTLQRPDGNVSSELSVGVGLDGREVEIPTLVPTLTPEEIAALLALTQGAEIPGAIVDKAVDHAIPRMREGLSPFLEPLPAAKPVDVGDGIPNMLKHVYNP